jgi:hypothetical protein
MRLRLLIFSALCSCEEIYLIHARDYEEWKRLGEGEKAVFQIIYLRLRITFTRRMIWIRQLRMCPFRLARTVLQIWNEL